MQALVLLGGGYLTGSWLNKRTVEDPKMDPQIFGMNAQMAIGGLSLLGMLLGGPLLGPLGAGALLGSAVSYDGMSRVGEKLSDIIKHEVLQIMSDDAPGQLDVDDLADQAMQLLQPEGP